MVKTPWKLANALNEGFSIIPRSKSNPPPPKTSCKIFTSPPLQRTTASFNWGKDFWTLHGNDPHILAGVNFLKGTSDPVIYLLKTLSIALRIETLTWPLRPYMFELSLSLSLDFIWGKLQSTFSNKKSFQLLSSPSVPHASICMGSLHILYPYSRFPGTVPVLALKILHPENSLRPRQTLLMWKQSSLIHCVILRLTSAQRSSKQRNFSWHPCLYSFPSSKQGQPLHYMLW